MRERPPTFRINRNSTLAKGLVFAGLGGGAGTLMYADASGYGNHGTLTNMDPPTDWVWVPELGRWALDFDGTDDYVALAQKTPIVGDWSFSVWYSWNPSENNSYVLLGSSDNELQRNNIRLRKTSDTDYIIIYVYFNDYSSVYWSYFLGGSKFYGLHNLTLAKNGESHELFLDGVSEGAKTTDKTINWSGLYFNFGATKRSSPPSYPFLGYIIDPLIYNRILSPAEIQQLADPSNVLLSGMIQNPRTKFWPAVLSASTIRQPWQLRRHRRMTGAA